MSRSIVAITVAGVLLSQSVSLRADVVGECVKAAEDSQELRAQKKLTQARERLQQCMLPACPKEVRNDCKTWLNDIESSMASIVVYAEDERGHSLVDVRVSIDDELVAEHLDNNALMLAPGEHTIKLETAAMLSATQKIILKNGEKNRRVVLVLTAQTTPAPQPTASSTASAQPTTPAPIRPTVTKRISPLAWVFYGVGAAALGTFAGLGISGKSDASTLRNTCAPNCSSADVDSTRMKLIGADISLGIALMSVGFGTYLVFNPSKVPSQSSRFSQSSTVSVSVAPTGQGGFATWGGVFLAT